MNRTQPQRPNPQRENLRPGREPFTDHEHGVLQHVASIFNAPFHDVSNQDSFLNIVRYHDYHGNLLEVARSSMPHTGIEAHPAMPVFIQSWDTPSLVPDTPIPRGQFMATSSHP